MKKIPLFLLLFIVLFSSVCCKSSNGFLSADDCILVNRSFLSNSFPDEKIYVIGHKSPDTDTVGSAVAYANLLNNLGYDCEARIAGKASNETKYVFELCNMEIPPVLEDATGKNIILVDNNEAVNAVSGIENANIIAVIDHHLINIRSKSPIHFETEYAGATASIIAADYQKYGVKVTPEMAKLLALTIMADTSNFSNVQETKADKILFDKLAGMTDISNPDVIYEKMKQEKQSYKGMTDKEIYHSDYKEYEIDGHKYSIGYVRATGKEAIRHYVQTMTKQMEEEYKEGKLDFLTCQIADRENDVSCLAYFGPESGIICKKAFSDIAEFKDNVVIIVPSVSRKTVLAPRINNAISQLNVL